MKNIISYLEQLGLSKIEAKLYIILLRSGPLTVATLAEAAKINRTAAYSHINSLLEKGIISKTKGTTNKISAVPPDSLHYLIDQKEIQIDLLKEKFPSMIMTLNSSISPTNSFSQGEMKYYKGKTGVKKIYEESFKTDILRSYFNAKDILKIFPENVKLFNDAFLYNPRIKMYEIVENSPDAIDQMSYFNVSGKHFYKCLPPDVQLTANDILIYDGKVAIINIPDKESVTGMILENSDYYNNSVQLFDLLWRLLPDQER